VQEFLGLAAQGVADAAGEWAHGWCAPPAMIDWAMSSG
jgi:hypothetical protein